MSVLTELAEPEVQAPAAAICAVHWELEPELVSNGFGNPCAKVPWLQSSRPENNVARRKDEAKRVNNRNVRAAPAFPT